MNSKKKMEFIVVGDGVKEKLAKTLGVSLWTVCAALNYNRNTDLYRRIRKAAMENGGERWVSVKETEVIYDSEGSMHQLFENGAKLEISKRDGTAKVWYRGELKVVYEKMPLECLLEIQRAAAAL